MTVPNGKRGTINERDREILMALFFCRYLSTKQIHYLFFGSSGRARARLAELQKKEYIRSRSMYVVEPKSWHNRVSPQGVWHLTKAASTPLQKAWG